MVNIRSSTCQGSKLWNKLPSEIRTLPSLFHFKNRSRKFDLLHLSITSRLYNSELNWQMHFLLLSIKCSSAPLSFRPCFLNCDQQYDLIIACFAVVRSWEGLPNIWLTIAKNAFVGWALNFRVCMLLKGAIRVLVEDDNCSNCVLCIS